MATKKSGTPVPEIPMDEDAELEEKAEKSQQMANMQAELAALKAENERLRKNSVSAASAYGGKSDRERVQEACRECAERGGDPWAEKISIRAPRKPAKEDNFYWLSVNGRTLQVPANDKYFEMALPFAQALTDMIAAEWHASDYADSIEDFDPVTNPHRE